MSDLPKPKMPSAFDHLPISQAAVARGPRGVAYVWRPAKGVIVSRIEGYFAEDAAALIDARARAAIAEDGFLLGIHDWSEVTDYATATRVRMTNAGTDVRAQTRGIHVLMKSKIVVLAVQTANLILRNVTAYSDRAEFERFLLANIRRLDQWQLAVSATHASSQRPMPLQHRGYFAHTVWAQVEQFASRATPVAHSWCTQAAASGHEPHMLIAWLTQSLDQLSIVQQMPDSGTSGLSLAQTS